MGAGFATLNPASHWTRRTGALAWGHGSPRSPAEVRRMKRSLPLACLLLLGPATFAQAEQGNPRIKTIEAIAFAPRGLLLIGGGARVVTVETGDTTPTPWSKTEIADIDQILAGKLGLQA